MWVVLGHGIGTGTQEVAIVREYEARHDRVEVYHAQHASVFVKHHVIDLGVAVADTLGQLASTSHALSLTHLVSVSL